MPMPSMCGIVRWNPKLAPEAISIRLFGPGVIDETKAKATKAERSSIDMAAIIN
ncbi:hypothetical protein GCM10016455_21400 [Aliiroseovarius zhejiangensis]|uniref:Uncharacterized protein n=1 Tax=Aliiroseovarius zhejiangensis TaxID=1632025 RepID=A0ABQ3J410_9RHOB|nr:hypothetical protein GCM10016455_21400 [Aliiroseovarius zhejiangensis]